MIVELGHLCLILALTTAGFQSALPFFANRFLDANPEAMSLLARGGALFTILAFLSLVYAYGMSDFSVLNVALNSHSACPIVYKITGVWSNHEGSMMLWVVVLASFGGGVSFQALPFLFKKYVLHTLGLIAFGFLSFIYLTSNPFLRLFPVPLNGEDLNPLLQDLALAFHPPCLYVGYVGYSVVFAFAIAALRIGSLDAHWAPQVKVWSLTSWIFLTLGITLGSLWAYYELGWGGWWFWDPVENASFVPWLLGTAFIHVVQGLEKEEKFKKWALLLALFIFSTSLMGTFLVRSGVLSSVHSFASDPARGLFILLLLVLTVGGAFTLYAFKVSVFISVPLSSLLSRSGGLMFNNLLLCSGAGVVFLGTIYPLLVDVMGYQKVFVGAPYFNSTFVPLMVPLLVALGIFPSVKWQDNEGLRLQHKLISFLLLTGLACISLWYTLSLRPVLATLGLGFSCTLAFSVLAEWWERLHLSSQTWALKIKRLRYMPLKSHGMTLAHLGVALVVLGICADAGWKHQKILAMAVGEAVELEGFKFTLTNVNHYAQDNYTADKATLKVEKEGKFFAYLYPEKRHYMVRGTTLTEASISTGLITNLYATLGERYPNNLWTVRLYTHPAVTFIWGGAVLMALGGILSLLNRRSSKVPCKASLLSL